MQERLQKIIARDPRDSGRDVEGPGAGAQFVGLDDRLVWCEIAIGRLPRGPDLFRVMHQVWSSLGGQGLAYSPYPDGPNRLITGAKGRIWDGGHLEWHGPYTSAAEAYKASIG